MELSVFLLTPNINSQYRKIVRKHEVTHDIVIAVSFLAANIVSFPNEIH